MQMMISQRVSSVIVRGQGDIPVFRCLQNETMTKERFLEIDKVLLNTHYVSGQAMWCDTVRWSHEILRIAQIQARPPLNAE